MRDPAEMHSPLKKALWASHKVDGFETEPSFSRKYSVSFDWRLSFISTFRNRDSLSHQWHVLGDAECKAKSR